jgi:type II secretory pathway pseudopilin PulG
MSVWHTIFKYLISRRKIMKINEKGRSMIEMLGVLAIIGVLSVGGIAGYSKAMAKFRANKTMDQVSHIVANTRILFGSQKSYDELGDSYSADNAQLMWNAHLLPDEMFNGESTDAVTDEDWINAYGGKVELYAGTRFAAEANQSSAGQNKKMKAFILVFNGIPNDACVDLASQNWDAASGSGLVAFAINDENDTNMKKAFFDNQTSTDCLVAPGQTGGAALVCYSKMPMSVANASKACQSGANSNRLSWKFY